MPPGTPIGDCSRHCGGRRRSKVIDPCCACRISAKESVLQYYSIIMARVLQPYRVFGARRGTRRRCRCVKEIPRIRVKSRHWSQRKGLQWATFELGRTAQSAFFHTPSPPPLSFRYCCLPYELGLRGFTGSAWRVSLAPLVRVALSCGLPRCGRRCRRRAHKLRVRNISQLSSARRAESPRRRSLFGRSGDEDAIVDSWTRLSMLRPNGTVRSVGWRGSWWGGGRRSRWRSSRNCAADAGINCAGNRGYIARDWSHLRVTARVGNRRHADRGGGEDK